MTTENGILDLSKINLTWLYFRNESILRFFCICFRKNNKELQIKILIDEGIEELENDFNFKNLMERYRKCEFESSCHHMNKAIDYSSFNETKTIQIRQVD